MQVSANAEGPAERCVFGRAFSVRALGGEARDLPDDVDRRGVHLV